MAIIQGGDPLSKDPAKAAALRDRWAWRAEGGVQRASRRPAARSRRSFSRTSQIRAGSQFFICVTDQPALDGKYTIFGRVSEGMDVAQKISEAPADADGIPAERIVITEVTIRDAPPPETEPFSTETAAELAQYHAVLETSLGRSRWSFSRQGARARAQFPPAGAVRGIRRNRLSSRRARVSSSRRARSTAAGRSPRSSENTSTPSSRSSATRRT